LDGSGRIRYTEFLAATIEAQGAISEERIAEAFDRLDSDDSGFISADNLAQMLGQDFPRDEIDDIIAEADLTKDNRISYTEFLALWENKHEHDRERQLKTLGVPKRIRNLSAGSSFSSVASVDSTEAHADFIVEKQSQARANFIVEKHTALKNELEKQVAFTETAATIPFNEEVPYGGMVEEFIIPVLENGNHAGGTS
jgi:hypothetical protein